MSILDHIPPVIQAMALVGASIGLTAYFVIQSRLGNSRAWKESNDLLRSLNDDLKQELQSKQTKHDTEIAELKKSYQSQIDNLQVQLNTMSEQLSLLQQANTALQNTVTGKDMLLEIKKSIEAFSPYVDHFKEIAGERTSIISKLDELIVASKVKANVS